MKITIGPRSLLLDELTDDDVSVLKALNDTAPSVAIYGADPDLLTPGGVTYLNHQKAIRAAITALIAQVEIAEGAGLAATADTHRANFDAAAKGYV